MKIRSLVRTDPRCERQDRKNDSCRNQADAVWEAKAPGQHRNDGGDQKQKSARLEIEFHALSCSPRFCQLVPSEKTKATERRNSDW